MSYFILTENKIFCPHCENEVINDSLKLVDNDYFMHECGKLVQNPLPKEESNLILRVETINIDFGLDEDTLQDYVNRLHKALKTLDTEPVKSIGHGEYIERTGYEETDPLETAEKRKKVFLTHTRST